MRKHTFNLRVLPLQLIALTVLCVAGSFTLGIKTAGDVKTITPSEALGTRLTGDINADGVLTMRDVIDILEIVRGYRQASLSELLADPNGDGQLTIDDALRILHDLELK